MSQQETSHVHHRGKFTSFTVHITPLHGCWDTGVLVSGPLWGCPLVGSGSKPCLPSVQEFHCGCTSPRISEQNLFLATTSASVQGTAKHRDRDGPQGFLHPCSSLPVLRAGIWADRPGHLTFATAQPSILSQPFGDS